MRKVINSTYITLDGVIQNPQDWPAMGGFGEAGNNVQTELLERCDAVLMTDDWARSTGAKAEERWALTCGIPVFYNPLRLREWLASPQADPAVDPHVGVTTE